VGADSALRIELTTLTPQEEDLRCEVREFLDREIPLEHRIGLGQAAGYDPVFSRKLGERGWIGITIPGRYGGGEGTSVQRYVVTEELLAAQTPVSAHWVADRQTAPALMNFGTEEQRRRLLPPIVKGECFFAIGMSETGAGSDLAAVRTRARKVRGGWSLSGTKIWTSGAQHADYLTVLCRSSGQPEDRSTGLSQLIVDLRDEGVEVIPIETLNGERDFCEVVLSEVFVPEGMVLGEIGEGWKQVTSELSYERYGPERWLSTWGVFTACLDALQGAEKEVRDVACARVGALAARYRVIRQLSLGVARSIDEGARPQHQSAAV
jgi:alkylation response protein AidB-like acyl-CoA dehydrogenase